jgi:hypothetical protein
MMKTMYCRTIYTKKFGIDFNRHAAYDTNSFYKYLIFIWIWNRVFAIFIREEE